MIFSAPAWRFPAPIKGLEGVPATTSEATSPTHGAALHTGPTVAIHAAWSVSQPVIVAWPSVMMGRGGRGCRVLAIGLLPP